MYKSLTQNRHPTRAPLPVTPPLAVDKGAKFEPFYTAGPLLGERCRTLPARRFDQKR